MNAETNAKSFADSLTRFSDNLFALREFVELVSAFLDERKKRIMIETAPHMGPMLLAVKQIAPGFLSNGPTLDELRKLLGKEVSIEIRTDEAKGPPSANLIIKGEAEQRFIDAIKTFDRSKKSIHLLYRSTLTNLISSVELFLSEMIHIYYEKFPEAIGGKDKVFSLEDLKGFDSVETARLYLIECRIESIMHGSFADWVAFFQTHPKLSLGYLKDQMPVLIEACQRRNLVIHNGGVVNSIYLSKVDKSLLEGIKAGQELEITPLYLTKRLEVFELTCSLLAFELWKKLDPTDKERGDFLIERIDELVLSLRWDIAEGLCYFLQNDKQMSEEHLLIGKLNYWFCLKRKGKWQDIRAEAEAEDMSATCLGHRLTWMALCENIDDFFKLLPDAIKSHELTVDIMEKLPIFSEVRKDKRFDKFRHPKRKPKRIPPKM